MKSCVDKDSAIFKFLRLPLRMWDRNSFLLGHSWAFNSIYQCSDIMEGRVFLLYLDFSDQFLTWLKNLPYIRSSSTPLRLWCLDFALSNIKICQIWDWSPILLWCLKLFGSLKMTFCKSHQYSCLHFRDTDVRIS